MQRPKTGVALIAAAALLLISTPSLARQAGVRGFVTDATSEAALQGATVALLRDGAIAYGTATDGDGYFLINRVAPGAYQFRVTFVGFRAHEEPLDLRGGGVVDRSIKLAPIDTPIDEVVVEAEAVGGVTTVVAGLESVVPADISRVPVPGVSGDLAGYMQTLPGVVIQGDRGGQFFVRGGAVDQNLALLDGLPVYMPFHVLSFYSAFPEEIVNRADLYTGGYGAPYGSRVSSIIDVEARNGNKQDLAATLGLAPFLSEARLEGPLVPNRVSVLLNVRQSLVEEVFPQLLGQSMPYRFGDRFGKIHALLGRSHALSFTVLDTEDRGDIAGTRKNFDGETIANTTVDSTTVFWDNRVIGGTYEYRSNSLPLVVKLTAGSSTMNNEFGPTDAPRRKSGVESFDVRGDFSWLLRRGSIDFGVTGRRSTLSYELDGTLEDYDTSSVDLTEVNAYAQTNLRLADDRWEVTPGIHLYSLPDRSRTWVEPRFRMSFYPNGRAGKLTLHAAWGVYHQAVVGLNDERDLGNQFTAWSVTPDDADVPAAMHAIAGGSYQVKPWLGVAIEGFYKKYDELSVPIFSAFPNFTTALQSADGTAYGFDVRLDMNGRPFIGNSTLNGYVTYALSKVEYEVGSIRYNPPHDRRHQLNAVLNADLDLVSFTVQFQFGSGLPYTESSGFDKWYLLTPDVDVASEPGFDRILYGAPYSGRQPTYSRMDLWLERRIENGRYVTTIKAGVVNVLNRDNLFYFDLFEFRRVDQLPLIPSVGIKFELR